MTGIGSSDYINLTDEVVRQETEIMRLRAKIGSLKRDIEESNARVAVLEGALRMIAAQDSGNPNHPPTKLAAVCAVARTALAKSATGEKG